MEEERNVPDSGTVQYQKNVPDSGTRQKLAEDMDEIFRERDRIYADREQRLEAWKQELREEAASLERERQEHEAEEEQIRGEREQIRLDRETLNRLSREMDVKREELEQRSDSLIQAKLQLERVKNQQLLAWSEREKQQDYRISGLLPENVLTVEEVEEKYLLRSEHQKLLNAVKEQSKEEGGELLKAQLTELLRLREEKERLYMENRNLQEENGCLQEENRRLRERVTQFQETAEQRAAPEREELTAEVLQHYLMKNAPDFEEVEILHTEGKNQLSARRASLEYRFTFENPCYFDVSAERKDSRKLREALKQLNEEFRDIKFFAEQDRASATAYFSPACPAYELMQTVERVSGLFES